MRLHRLKLANYRGVSEREVVFAPEGTTVVEGPNEAGKSSMIEALDLLLEAKDSSKTKQVRAVAPKGSDAAPFVEAEVESGPYRFVYTKQWLKRPATTLDVLEPRREQLTGEAAHERVQAMLASTVDLELWKALRMLQTARGQVEVDGCPALLKALDAAAGPVTLSGTETTLLAKIEAEVRRYRTPSGRPTGELRAAQERAAAAQDRHATAREALESVEADAQLYDELSAQLKALQAERAEAAGALGRARERWESVRGLEGQLDLAKERAALAQAQAQAAAKDMRQRKEWEGEEQSQTKAVDELKALLAQAQERLERAETDHSITGFDYYELCRQQNEQQLADARKRLAEIEEAQAGLARAQATLAAAIDRQSAERAVQAARQVELAEAKATAASAKLVVTMLAERRIELDGEALQVGRGEVVEGVVVQPISLVVPDVLTVQVHPGPSGEELARQLADARKALAAALHEAGSGGTAEVADRMAERAHAEAQVEQNRKFLNSVSGYESAATLRARVVELLAEADNLEQCPKWDGLRPEMTLKEAEESYRSAERSVAAAKNTFHDLATRLPAAKNALAKASALLSQTREEESDGQLRERSEHLEAAASATQTTLAELQARVAEADLGAARAEVASAEQRDIELAGRFDSVRDEAAQTAGRLSVGAHAGHQEVFDATGSELAHAQEELERVSDRARAAQLLWETVTARRDAAQSRYAAPLEHAINELGASVFGDSFAVRLDGQLRVDSRTLRGTTVDFDSLSEGAKEQVTMLVRLACAKLVDPVAGAPVVIDDALGHSDPHRLAKMRDVLAASTGQVIVLTCFPERFGSIGTTVRL